MVKARNSVPTSAVGIQAVFIICAFWIKGNGTNRTFLSLLTQVRNLLFRSWTFGLPFAVIWPPTSLNELQKVIGDSCEQKTLFISSSADLVVAKQRVLLKFVRVPVRLSNLWEHSHASDKSATAWTWSVCEVLKLPSSRKPPQLRLELSLSSSIKRVHMANTPIAACNEKEQPCI